ncbi:ATP-binding cassette domain-containing protein [Robertmurraya massiliosenegalensis]|uniref:energy-coupling factor ABC transporter ATP-binding protein n=1 Tax=Robertmurraya TaxID=2837507 RepID=UPI0039A4175C
MEHSFLELKDVFYQYPDGTLALNNISLQIKKGKKIALLGNNGAGKSTLLLHLNAILTPTKGQLFYKGKAFSYKRKEKNRLRGDVGIVFQDPDTQLFSSSVYEDIQYGPRNMGLSKEEIESVVQNAMELTDTFTLQEKPPHFLSVGQKKRVAIAGILAMNPELMIFDEPTAGLDPYYSKEMVNMLHLVASENRTILVSTHDVDFAYEWADEIWVLSDGSLIAQNVPSKVFQDPQLLAKSHLRLPWILEVFEQMKGAIKEPSCPRSKKDLFEILQQLAFPKERG